MRTNVCLRNKCVLRIVPRRKPSTLGHFRSFRPVVAWVTRQGVPSAPTCLILFAHRVVPGILLIVAANRDERFDRPAAPAAVWDDHPEILAGRDLSGGGTWPGVSRSGRFAALTNFRNPAAHRADAPSRGEPVKAFLVGQMSARTYVEDIVRETLPHNGFCLLVGDDDRLFSHSIDFAERSFHSSGGIAGEVRYRLDMTPSVSL